ncbi:MAG: hypothetical protein OEZ39_10185 [Gammaproteobacteria bacterium]|nr:hypothetical protein [Gammaproteobacteria bacterium]MDH5652211.1 hypothetical protein [Gammaproteobacteria bacterium]
MVFLYGLPGETPDDDKLTLAYSQTLAELGARVNNHTFLPLPGTPFRNSPAGDIDMKTQREIVLMESDGKAFGKWKGQLARAKELVHLRESKK